MNELTQTRGAVARRGGPDTYRAPFAWQLAGGQGDGRWGAQATRYEYMNGQCRYCGSHCDGPAHSVTAHPRALCLACGTPQCDKQHECEVCMVGYVGRAPYSVRADGGSCGYAGCTRPAVAKAPRVKRVCLADLARPAVILAGVRIPLADMIASSLAQRDLGGLNWQKLAWFGPPLRYAVRRWHDDGRTGWTTGASPQGFETAGQADREAAAWNDPRTSDGWHAVRVTLSPQLWDDIRAWEGRAAGRAKAARL